MRQWKLISLVGVMLLACVVAYAMGWHYDLGRLRHAVIINDQAQVAMLLRWHPDWAKRVVDPDFGTALNIAVENGNDPMVRLILKYPCDLNYGAPASGTPLQNASGYGRKQIVKALLDAGADINLAVSVSNASGTPLQSAVLGGQYEVVAMLVERGADVNGLDPTGYRMPPLMLATRQVPGKTWEEQKRILQYLLVQGAKMPNADTLGMHGNSASQWARIHETPPDIVEILKANGAKE